MLFLILVALNFRLFASKGILMKSWVVEVDKPNDPINESVFQREKGKIGREVFLPELSLIKSQFVFFDPLIFSITSNKDSVEIGQKFVFNINVELISFSWASIFQFQDLTNIIRCRGKFTWQGCIEAYSR